LFGSGDKVDVPVINKKINDLEKEISNKSNEIFGLKVEISDLRMKERDFVHKDLFFQSLAASNGRKL
jgi:wobble nucleotide-excising tRNase